MKPALKAAFEDLQDALSAAPEALAVIPVPRLPPLVEDFLYAATLDSARLKAAEIGLPLVLAEQTNPKEETPKAADLKTEGVRANIFFKIPQADGRVAVVFETSGRVRVRHSDADGGYIAAVARPDDFWRI